MGRHVATRKETQKKLSILRLSTGLDKLNCLKVKRIITDNFHNSPIKVTVYTQPQQPIANPSGTHKEEGTKNDMRRAQEDNQSLSTVRSWAINGKQSHFSVLQGHSRDTGVLLNNFDSFKLVNDLLCQCFEDFGSQQVVPTTWQPKILERIHSSTTAAHLGVTKTLEKLELDSIGQDIRSMLVHLCQSDLLAGNVTASNQSLGTALSIGLPVSLLPTLELTSLDHFQSQMGIHMAIFGDHFTKWYEAVPMPDQTVEVTATALNSTEVSCSLFKLTKREL